MDNNYNTFRRFDKNGKLCDTVTTKNDYPSDGRKDWIKAPNGDILAHNGDDREWFDKDMRRIPDDELVRQGRRKDDRGLVYSIIDMSEREIKNLGEKLAENETKERPLENEQFQKFDGKKWVVDKAKKEKAEKEKELNELQGKIGSLESEISSRDWRVIKAQRLNKDVDELYPGESEWYEDTVVKINKLREELVKLKQSA
jgi:chromosome segregation ATPase